MKSKFPACGRQAHTATFFTLAACRSLCAAEFGIKAKDVSGELRPVGAVERAVLNGFAELARLNLRNTVEVGDGASDF